MGMVKGQGHIIQLICFLSDSNQSNQQSWDTAISKFDLEKSKVKVMVENEGWSHIYSWLSIWQMHFFIV